MKTKKAAYTALQLGAMLQKKEITAREALQASLARAQETEPSLHALTELDEAFAFAQADKAQERLLRGEALSPLDGVAVGVKDLLCIKGRRTCCGSKMLLDYVSPYDATAAARLKAGGVVLAARCNMDEFAMGSTTETSIFGATRNPWALDRVPGGSSGGSAACVAAAQFTAAIGSDTGGSIRQPAAYCGVTGFKPSYGVISRYGLVAYASSLDQLSPIAVDARDCAALTDLMRGVDGMDATACSLPDTTSLLAQCDGNVKGLRVGLPKECFADGLDPEIRAAVLALGDTLKSLGAKLVPVELPALKYAIPAYYVLACAEASSNLSRYDGVKYGYCAEGAEDVLSLHSLSRTKGFGREVQRRILLGTFVLSSGYYDAFYGKAVRAQWLIREGFAQAFTQADVLLTPVAPTPAPKLGESLSDPMKMYLSDIYTVSVNLAGLPAAALPCGFTKDGLPIGAQLIGPRLGDGTVLRAADACQRVTDFHLARPEVETA